MKISDAAALKGFLVRELAHMSDADPDILSDYILALLKHDKPGLEESCVQQLADFLHDYTRPFVKKLFRYLEEGEERERAKARAAGERQRSAEDPEPKGGADARRDFGGSDAGKSFARSGHGSERMDTRGRHEAADSKGQQQQQHQHHRSAYENPARSHGDAYSERDREGREQYDEGGSRDRDRRRHKERYEKKIQEPEGRGMEDVQRPARARSRSPEPRSTGRRTRDDGPLSATRLIIDRIPHPNATEASVESYFSRFGAIRSVKMMGDGGGRAIIEYEDKESAADAIRCPDAMFGNRFVRLFYDRATAPSHVRTAVRPAAAAPHSAALPKTTTYTAPNYQPPAPPPDRAKQMLELSKQKQELLAAYLEQQKLLLERLETDETLDDSAKNDIVASLRTVDEKISSVSIERPPPAAPDASRVRMPAKRKLDLRPTSLLIRPLPEMLSDGSAEAANILLSSFGSIKDVRFGGCDQLPSGASRYDHLIVTYSSRQEAEKAFKMLPKANLGITECTWHHRTNNGNDGKQLAAAQEAVDADLDTEAAGAQHVGDHLAEADAMNDAETGPGEGGDSVIVRNDQSN